MITSAQSKRKGVFNAGGQMFRAKAPSQQISVTPTNQKYQVHIGLVLTLQIEEESPHIQLAPCFGRSPAGWQVSSKVLIAVGNQYGLANLRCASSNLSQSNYSRSFSNADWTSRPSTLFCFQKPARTRPTSLSELLFTTTLFFRQIVFRLQPKCDIILWV